MPNFPAAKCHLQLWIQFELSSAKDDLYYLEQAARVQVLAMSTHLPLALVDEEVCKVTKILVPKCPQ